MFLCWPSSVWPQQDYVCNCFLLNEKRAQARSRKKKYNSSNGTDIHGDYYTYGTQFDQIPPISTNFLHVFNTTPNATFTETKRKQIPTTSLQSGNINADQEETESHPSLTSNAFRKSTIFNTLTNRL